MRARGGGHEGTIKLDDDDDDDGDELHNYTPGARQ